MSRPLNEVKELASKIGRIRGVLAVIMFGSYAREEFDEGSDVDILVLFSDREAYRLGRDEVWKLASMSEAFVQVITMTLEEINSSPLLTSILRDGITLFKRKDFDLREMIAFSPIALISYDLRDLDPTEKVKILHRLYGRRGKRMYVGIVEQLGGYKVGRSSFIVPYDRKRDVLDFLDEKEIPYVVRYLWVPKLKREPSFSMKERGNSRDQGYFTTKS